MHVKMFFRILNLQLKLEFSTIYHNSFNTRGRDSSVRIATR
jgi:hypothetical protein